MTQIDTSNWKKFKIGELFETVNNNGKQVPTGANVPSLELKSGTVPRISVTGVNNGVVGYYDSTHKNYKVYNNFISVNFLGNAFYQENNASLDMKVHCLKLKNKELNKYLALFLVTIINKLTTSYSYASQLSSTSITQLQLPLPVTTEGTPDFDYMEDYMKEITKLAAKRVEKVKEEKPQTKIDTSNWGKFRIGDLFAIYLGDYNNPKFLTEDEDGIPLVSATTTNNGISGYYKKTPDLKVITKNKITWGKQCPYFYYQTTDFITGQGTYYLDVSALSFYTNLFICAVLNNKISQKYGYNNCLIGKKLSEEIILLPITTEGSPDWQFMEDYMKNIMEQAKKKLSNIPQ